LKAVAPKKKKAKLKVIGNLIPQTFALECNMRFYRFILVNIFWSKCKNSEWLEV